ncbi:MAG: glycine cleavage system pyridoxal-binding protein P, partial [Candidatus Binatia bacterium]
MLQTIGVGHSDELFTAVPPALRNTAALNLPDGLSEQDVATRMEELAARNQASAG